MLFTADTKDRNDLLDVQPLIYVCLLVFIGIPMIDRAVSRGVVCDFLSWQQNCCQHPEFRSGTNREPSKYFSGLVRGFCWTSFFVEFFLHSFFFFFFFLFARFLLRKYLLDVETLKTISRVCVRIYTELGQATVPNGFQ